MNLQQFQTLSKRTMPFNGEPKNNQEYENMLGNYAMGLVGEAVELLEAKATNSSEIIKEIGDVSHYAVGIAAITKIDLPIKPMLLSEPLSMIFNRLLFACKEVSERAKKTHLSPSCVRYFTNAYQRYCRLLAHINGLLQPTW